MEIIIKPVLTEKMTALTDKQRKVAFIVAKEANKIEIKKAVEAMYGVNVLAVNTQRYQIPLYQGRCNQRTHQLVQESNCDFSRR
mgnify:CR=1 FL=1